MAADPPDHIKKFMKQDGSGNWVYDTSYSDVANQVKEKDGPTFGQMAGSVGVDMGNAMTRLAGAGETAKYKPEDKAKLEKAVGPVSADYFSKYAQKTGGAPAPVSQTAAAATQVPTAGTQPQMVTYPGQDSPSVYVAPKGVGLGTTMQNGQVAFEPQMGYAYKGTDSAINAPAPTGPAPKPAGTFQYGMGVPGPATNTETGPVTAPRARNWGDLSEGSQNYQTQGQDLVDYQKQDGMAMYHDPAAAKRTMNGVQAIDMMKAPAELQALPPQMAPSVPTWIKPFGASLGTDTSKMSGFGAPPGVQAAPEVPKAVPIAGKPVAPIPVAPGVVATPVAAPSPVYPGKIEQPGLGGPVQAAPPQLTMASNSVGKGPPVKVAPMPSVTMPPGLTADGLDGPPRPIRTSSAGVLDDPPRPIRTSFDGGKKTNYGLRSDEEEKKLKDGVKSLSASAKKPVKAAS